ncbi:CaiB/BaiF CoA transferase family protein [Nocardioides sp.]|uniref:CaiB/BaiF CoA transferase family protein n=1 Tax=Nocardioides sp. TaxID=35761 RepID=UPI003D12645E
MTALNGSEPTRALPLADVRIIAIEQYGAGPFGSMHLADLGAEVIKIEDPSAKGDIGRYVPPFQVGEDNLFFESLNRNKRSISLDLSSAAGRDVFEDLVRSSDVVFSNMRGDVPAKMRIRYEDLRDLNPTIVCCSLSGFGTTGPRAAEPGYDYIIQGLAGWMDVTGEPDGPPSKSGLSLVDWSGGYVAAMSILVGLHVARRDGQGSDCDVSLFDNAISLLTYLATWNLSADYQPKRTRHSAHPSIVPFQNFQTSDGWIVVGCAKDHFWTKLVEAIGLPELAENDDYATLAERYTHRDEVLAILEERFLQRTKAEWLPLLALSGVPSAPVNSIAEALQDPQVAARHLIAETDHPSFGRVLQIVSAVRVGEPMPTAGRFRRAPRRNEDADYVLGSVLGYDEDHVTSLSDKGAFGATPASEPTQDPPLGYFA